MNESEITQEIEAVQTVEIQESLDALTAAKYCKDIREAAEQIAASCQAVQEHLAVINANRLESATAWETWPKSLADFY